MYASGGNWPSAKRRGRGSAWCLPASSRDIVHLGGTDHRLSWSVIPHKRGGWLTDDKKRSSVPPGPSFVGSLDEPLAGLHASLDAYNIGGFRGFLQIPFEQIERRGITALLIRHLAHQPAQARIGAPRVGSDTFPGGLLGVVITIQIAVRAALDQVHARIGARDQPVHHRGPARGFRRILVFGSHVRQLYERFGIGRVHRNGLRSE